MENTEALINPYSKQLAPIKALKNKLNENLKQLLIPLHRIYKTLNFIRMNVRINTMA